MHASRLPGTMRSTCKHEDADIVAKRLRNSNSNFVCRTTSSSTNSRSNKLSGSNLLSFLHRLDVLVEGENAVFAAASNVLEDRGSSSNRWVCLDVENSVRIRCSSCLYSARGLQLFVILQYSSTLEGGCSRWRVDSARVQLLFVLLLYFVSKVTPPRANCSPARAAKYWRDF